MTVYEKLIVEFGAAIKAILGDNADKEFNDESVDREELLAIAKKVCFYLDK